MGPVTVLSGVSKVLHDCLELIPLNVVEETLDVKQQNANCYIMAGMFTRRESSDQSTRTKQEDKGSECKLQRVT